MMLEAKDPAIRLFGRTIQLNDDVSVAVDSQHTSSDHNLCSSNGSVSPQSVLHKNPTDEGGSMDLKLEHGSSSSTLENISEDQSKSSIVSGDTQVLTEEDKESSSPKASEKEEEEGSSGSQEKPLLKKPTKILPCPRCNSTDTKFCYFNNYNVNQPRHFCKNCQRYWTAGGTMRSMVIGAGRRRNKSSCFSHHPFVIPNVLQAHHPDGPLSELTMEEDPSRHDSGINSDAQKSATISFQSFATLWPNPWNPAHPTSLVQPPAFVPIYAVPPYWGCGALTSWNATWTPPPPASASANQHATTTLKPISPLGKHPRDGSPLKTSNKEHHGEDKRTETKVLVPKTLRFDDPSEAAKSSIWTTLGIKNEKTRSPHTHTFFGGFQSKGGETNSTKLTSRLLQANPAALSRSLTFHECGA